MLKKNFAMNHSIHIDALLALATLLVLAACRSGEDDGPVVPSDKERPIVFGQYARDYTEAGRASRAGLETIGIGNFKAWGYKTMNLSGAGTAANPYYYSQPQNVMTGYYMQWRPGSAGTSASNSQDWEYVGFGLNNVTQTIKYWDFSATSYRFFALAPNSVTTQVTYPSTTECEQCAAAGGKACFAELPVTASGSQQTLFSELWLSRPSVAAPSYGDCVQLEFTSLFARVRFLFKYPEGITPNMVAMTDVTLRPVDDSPIPTGAMGGVKVHYPVTGSATAHHVVWPATAAAYSSIEAFTCPYEEAPLVHATEAGKWYSVVPVADVIAATVAPHPVTLSDYHLTGRINGKAYDVRVPMDFVQWRSNYEYTYVFKITDTSIAFDSVIEVYTKWQAGYSETTEW